MLYLAPADPSHSIVAFDNFFRDLSSWIVAIAATFAVAVFFACCYLAKKKTENPCV